MIRPILWATVLAGGVAAADPNPGAAPASAPPPAVSASAATPPDTAAAVTSAPTAAASRHGLALGVELGEPTSATAAFYTGSLVLAGSLGSGTYLGPGLSLHADAQLEVTRLAPAMPLRVGLGLRYYHHGYRPASLDEIPDSHYGVRGSIAVAIERGGVELYAEAAPGVDFKRTTSCTLMSGANSICPHTMDSPLFLQLVLGARWFLSN